MDYITFDRPITGRPFLAPAMQRVLVRRRGFFLATTAAHDPNAICDNPVLSECLVASNAGFAVAATACQRPLLFSEMEFVSHASGYDMALLRFDPDKGISCDVLLRGREYWLCRYLAWRRRGGELWLIPSATDGPFICACRSGLILSQEPPFASGQERHDGIILAIDSPSFEGRI